MTQGKTMTDRTAAIVLRFVGEPADAGLIGTLESEGIEKFGGDLGLCHVDAVLPPGDPQAGWLLGARSDQVGAIPPGVQIRPPDYRAYRTVRLVSVPCTPDQADRFYQRLKGEIGRPYSPITIVGLMIGHDFHDAAGWICDKLQAWSACEEDILPADLLSPYLDELTPNSLWIAAAVAARYLAVPA